MQLLKNTFSHSVICISICLIPSISFASIMPICKPISGTNNIHLIATANLSGKRLHSKSVIQIPDKLLPTIPSSIAHTGGAEVYATGICENGRYIQVYFKAMESGLTVSGFHMVKAGKNTIVYSDPIHKYSISVLASVKK